MSLSQVGVGIEASRLSFRYHGHDKSALEQVSFSLAPGEACLVVGSSGSGKSTLARLIAGLIDSDDGVATGELRLGGASWFDKTVPVGVVLQQPDDQTILHSIGDDIAFGLENLGVSPEEMSARISEALSSVGLDLPLDHPTEGLSGGQRQRLALAGAIAMRPGVLVLDEPLQALDREGRREVLSAIEALRQRHQITLVVVDHEPAQWRGLVDRVLELDHGRVCSNELVATSPIEWEHAVNSPPRDQKESPEIALSVEQLVVGRTAALPGVHDFVVHRGEIVALVGPNGAGKTTLALTLAGLLTPLGGVIRPFDSLHSMTSAALAKTVSFVPQNPAHHHVAETVRGDLEVSLSGSDVSPSARDHVISQQASRFDLEPLFDRHPASLSGGEARRLALAGATISAPGVLILDEPTQSLDRESWDALVHHLRALSAEGVAIVLSTHDDQLVSVLGAKAYQVAERPAPAIEPAPSSTPGWLERANPLALIASSLALAVALIARVDVTEAAIALSVSVALLVATGALHVSHALRLAPVGVAALFAALTIALYGQVSGTVLFEWGIMRVSEGSLDLALATLLRVLAIAIPAIALFQHIVPTRLADSLTTYLRAPERFVVGALSATRLVSLLGADYQQIRATRRSRGLGDSPWWKRIGRDSFSLLVVALSRAKILATAMEARGFGRAERRTHYRVSTWHGIDWVIIALGVAIAILARVGGALL